MTIHNTEFPFTSELPQPAAETLAVPTSAPEEPVPHQRTVPAGKLPFALRSFIEASGELMSEHTTLTRYLTTLASDTERLLLCEQALRNSADEMRQHSARALRAGILAATMCRLYHKPGLAHKRAAAQYRRKLFEKWKLGTSSSQLSRNLRAGALFLELRAAGLPVSGESAGPLVYVLPLKERAIAAWRHLVTEAKGEAPQLGAVAAYVRNIRGTKARPRSVKSHIVLEACSDLLRYLPRGTPAEADRYAQLDKLVRLARGDIKPGKTPAKSAG